jgi:hypothetical protein
LPPTATAPNDERAVDIEATDDHVSVMGSYASTTALAEAADVDPPIA